MRARLAHVLDEHTEIRGPSDHRRTVHFVSLGAPSGTRSSDQVPASLARRLTRGDMGVAHTKGSEIVGFIRVDV